MQAVYILSHSNLGLRTTDASGPKMLKPPLPLGTLKAPYKSTKIIKRRKHERKRQYNGCVIYLGSTTLSNQVPVGTTPDAQLRNDFKFPCI